MLLDPGTRVGNRDFLENTLVCVSVQSFAFQAFLWVGQTQRPAAAAAAAEAREPFPQSHAR